MWTDGCGGKKACPYEFTPQMHDQWLVDTTSTINGNVLTSDITGSNAYLILSVCIICPEIVHLFWSRGSALKGD